MERTPWQELPPAARRAVEAHTGAVEGAESADKGVMSRLACTLCTASGLVFIKGTRADDASAWMYRTEAKVTAYAPIGPRLLWEAEGGGWLLVGYEHVPGRHPDLAPGSADLVPLVGALTAMSTISWPRGVGKKPLPIRWGSLIPDGRARHLDGRSLAHTDMSPLNMLATPDGIRLVDWALACPAPDWADSAFTVPRLIHAGHTVEQAEAVAHQVPAYRSASPEAVSTFAHALLAVWESREKADPLPHRGALIAAARAWADHRALTVV
ncbi:aminoglycoside phosphotransferase [Streptomyces sp. ASQP_92]|uniref:aminoglycoside phosphotransferase n=1 Tax=Streptomyces sp. ASQP_92 TaxID=2979116 RepID=UPI0021BE08FE|nr:aminoglycoside phosphotransferase [Streptomyces sp. ASQP_92]MCT9090618.1 aminoglycoside phosphotransferase [Streptomyces sp. ASQP_92]